MKKGCLTACWQTEQDWEPDLNSNQEEVKELYQQCISSNKGRLIVHGLFARANSKNINSRLYPKHILQREVRNFTKQRVQENHALGELDHPNYSSYAFKFLNLPNLSHQILDLTWKNNKLFGFIEILDTPSGNLLRSLYSQGVRLGVSSRGWASLELDTKNDCQVIQNDFELITFDFVTEPSTQGAYLLPYPQKYKKNLPPQSIATSISHYGFGAVQMDSIPQLPAPEQFRQFLCHYATSISDHSQMLNPDDRGGVICSMSNASSDSTPKQHPSRKEQPVSSSIISSPAQSDPHCPQAVGGKIATSGVTPTQMSPRAPGSESAGWCSTPSHRGESESRSERVNTRRTGSSSRRHGSRRRTVDPNTPRAIRAPAVAFKLPNTQDFVYFGSYSVHPQYGVPQVVDGLRYYEQHLRQFERRARHLQQDRTRQRRKTTSSDRRQRDRHGAVAQQIEQQSGLTGYPGDIEPPSIKQSPEHVSPGDGHSGLSSQAQQPSGSEYIDEVEQINNKQQLVAQYVQRQQEQKRKVERDQTRDLKDSPTPHRQGDLQLNDMPRYDYNTRSKAKKQQQTQQQQQQQYIQQDEIAGTETYSTGGRMRAYCDEDKASSGIQRGQFARGVQDVQQNGCVQVESLQQQSYRGRGHSCSDHQGYPTARTPQSPPYKGGKRYVNNRSQDQVYDLATNSKTYTRQGSVNTSHQADGTAQWYSTLVQGSDAYQPRHPRTHTPQTHYVHVPQSECMYACSSGQKDASGISGTGGQVVSLWDSPSNSNNSGRIPAHADAEHARRCVGLDSPAVSSYKTDSSSLPSSPVPTGAVATPYKWPDNQTGSNLGRGASVTSAGVSERARRCSKCERGRFEEPCSMTRCVQYGQSKYYRKEYEEGRRGRMHGAGKRPGLGGNGN